MTDYQNWPLFSANDIGELWWRWKSGLAEGSFTHGDGMTFMQAVAEAASVRASALPASPPAPPAAPPVPEGD